jgi:rhodanese-related sulfurtransferase
MEGCYVDVRELDEFKAGHLKGAIHCPLSELKKGNIPTDLPNDTPLYLYCSVGGRAQIAKSILISTYPLAQSIKRSYEELLKIQATHPS